MEWSSDLAAVPESLESGELVVHIIYRRAINYSSAQQIKPPQGDKLTHIVRINAKALCGHQVTVSVSDLQRQALGTDITCEACIVALERNQAWWTVFWRSTTGQAILNKLTGNDRIEEEYRELSRDMEALQRRVDASNNLIDSCLQYKEPVFTLELPDEFLLQLVTYSCVGEVLLALKFSKETRTDLEDRLGKVGFALLGSRLISKGYLKADDEIFGNW